MLARLHPAGAGSSLPDLPPLSDPFTPSPAAVDDFSRKGHGVFRGVLSRSEAAAWAAVVQEARTAGHWDGLRSMATGEVSRPIASTKPFIRVHNLFWGSPSLAKFVTSARLGTLAAVLLGVERVRVCVCVCFAA